MYISLLGQLFLHRVFGYRGVLLFPWAAKVFDRDQQTTKAGEKFETTKPSPKSKGARNDPTKPKDSKISTMSYYQVCKNNKKDVWEHPFRTSSIWRGVGVQICVKFADVLNGRFLKFSKT